MEANPRVNRLRGNWGEHFRHGGGGVGPGVWGGAHRRGPPPTGLLKKEEKLNKARSDTLTGESLARRHEKAFPNFFGKLCFFLWGQFIVVESPPPLSSPAMDPVTISDLAAAFAKLEKRVVVLEEEKEELKADNKELKAGKAEQEKRVTYLVKRNKQQAKEIQAIKGQLRELQPPAAELVFGWARRWSGLMGLGGLIGPGLGLGSVLSKDALMASKMAWASASFLVFSVTCLIATTLGNVRNIGTRGERALACLCMLLIGAAWFLPGYAFAGSEDEYTTYWG